MRNFHLTRRSGDATASAAPSGVTAGTVERTVRSGFCLVRCSLRTGREDDPRGERSAVRRDWRGRASDEASETTAHA